MNSRNKNKDNQGFTLIELLVVIAIIGLLSSIVLIALIQARQKSRDVKRLSDMTQMNTALELFFAANKGYPSSSNGMPQDMQPTFLVTLPKTPTPGDGACDQILHSAVVCGTDSACLAATANQYYYEASGTSYLVNGLEVYPDYSFGFCLGNATGNFAAGERVVTPRGVK